MGSNNETVAVRGKKGARIKPPDPVYVDPTSGEGRLWLAVLRQAIADMSSPDWKTRCEAEDFVMTRRSNAIFQMFGIRRGMARRLIRTNPEKVLMGLDREGPMFKDCVPDVLTYNIGRQLGRKRGRPSQFGVAA